MDVFYTVNGLIRGGEAHTAIDVLNYVATGVAGVDRDYHFHPDRYKPEPAHAKREGKGRLSRDK